MAALGRGFGISLGASAAAALLGGGLLLVLPAPEGGGAAALLRWGGALLPQALAAAAAGILSRSFGAAALNALGFFLPQACALVLGFLVFVHPGGPAGLPALLGTGLFWLELGALYLASLALVGGSSAVAQALLRG